MDIIEDRYKINSNDKTLTTDELLAQSSLSQEVLDEIEKVFETNRPSADINKSLIQENTVRLLEELPVADAKIALNEFVNRCIVAPEKICKSKAGYLRGVCLKYWKTGRAATKQRLADSYRKGDVVDRRQLVQDFIDHCFTPGSKLSLSMVDATVRRKLFQLEPLDALDVIFEFVSAVTFRTSKIRNINAYIMSMIKKAESFGHSHMKSINEILYRQKYRPPSSPSGQEPVMGPGSANNSTRNSLSSPRGNITPLRTSPRSPQSLTTTPQSLASPRGNNLNTSQIESFKKSHPVSPLNIQEEKFSPSQTSPSRSLWPPTTDFSTPKSNANISYVSGSDNEGPSSEQQDHSTGSSSSGGAQTPLTAHQQAEKDRTKMMEATIRQQKNEITSLKQKIAELELRLMRNVEYEDSYDSHYNDPYNRTPRTSTSETLEQTTAETYENVFKMDKYSTGFDNSFYHNNRSEHHPLSHSYSDPSAAASQYRYSQRRTYSHGAFY